MRIKRFQAPDMRTALRMIRDEQGPDAVILSNRAVAGGIEVVAATDYDEALVSQALRAAAPGLETIVPVAPMQSAPAEAAPAAQPRTPPADPAASFAALLSSRSRDAQAAAVDAALPESVAAAVAVVGQARRPAPRPEPATPARESLLARARAVFRIGEDDAHAPTLAELAPQAPLRTPSMQAGPASDDHRPAARGVPAPQPQRPDADAPAPDSDFGIAAFAPRQAAPASSAAEPTRPLQTTDVARPSEPTTSVSASASASARISAATAADVEAATENVDAIDSPRHLHAVPAPQPPDPAMVAMRDELARMRKIMEAQMEQLSLERLRGSPARAAAIDALLGFGCEDSLAQAVAARLDPRLPPGDIHAPMRSELARMIAVARSEPIEEGGVIALVGPTGAGKTTTAAKLAARFAARHRARDVALVSTDLDRAGAREQLHTLGRRLGVTVCEAAGPEGLQDALAQLADYPLVLVDTAGHAPRDRALFGQILWLRASRAIRSLLVLPANAHPHDLGEVIRRYRPAAPEGVVLTKLDETGRLGSALSVVARHGLDLAYTAGGQQVPSDLDAADAQRLVHALELSTRAADNPFAIEDRHAV